MILLSTGCGSGAVAPSDEPELTASRQQEPAPPESLLLSNLRSADWAQAHGLPVNPHRGNGPSITFYGPNGSIRRHIPFSETSLRPPPRASRAGFALLPASFEGGSGRFEEAKSSRLVRQGVLTDSVVTIGSTEQLWVFEDGVLITKTILVIDADTVAGASQFAFDDFGELAAEQWVPRSAMGPIDDPEDPQWEMNYPLAPDPSSARVVLAACATTAAFDACGEAITYAAGAAVLGAAAGAVCARFRVGCSYAAHRGRIFKAAVIAAIAVCAWEWETGTPQGSRAFIELYSRAAEAWGIGTA